MRRINPTYIFLVSCYLMFVLFSGCKKERLGSMNYTGTVTNLTTGDVADGVKVQLIEEHMPSEPFSTVTRTVLQEVETDASGHFHFEPLNKTRRNADYYIEVERNWYYANHGWQKGDYLPVASIVNVDDGVSEPLELQTVPLGEFNLRIKNTTSDSIFVHGVFRNGLLDINVVEMAFFGRQFFVISDVEVPSGNYQVDWLVVHAGDSIKMTEELSVPFAEVVDFSFDY